ncbi:hypothetical protein QOT17_006812 [Balamuthia mandrillaris]
MVHRQVLTCFTLLCVVSMNKLGTWAVDVKVDESSICETRCSFLGVPFHTIEHAKAQKPKRRTEAVKANDMFRVLLAAGSYNFPTNFNVDAQPNYFSIIGSGINATTLTGAIPFYTVDITLKDLTIEPSESIGIGGELALERVHLKHFPVQQTGNLITANVIISDSPTGAVHFLGEEWRSYDDLMVENIEDVAILVESWAVWRQIGRVTLRAASPLAVLLLGTWECGEDVTFENNDNAVWVVQEGVWNQWGEVLFRGNQNRFYSYWGELGTVNGSDLVYVHNATWNSYAPVEFLDNDVSSEAPVKLVSHSFVLSTYTIENDFGRSMPLFSCEDSHLVAAESCTIECGCTRRPTISMKAPNNYIRNKEGALLVNPSGNLTVLLESSAALTSPLTVRFTVEDPREGGESWVEPNTVDLPMYSSHREVQLTVRGFSEGQQFGLSLQPYLKVEAVQEPDYIIAHEAARLELIYIAGGVALPSLVAVFPSLLPNFVAVPVSKEGNVPEPASVSSNFQSLVEVDPLNANAQVKSQPLLGLTWGSSASLDGVYTYSTTFTLDGSPASTSVRLLFSPAAAGEEVVVRDQTAVPFQMDSLKWTLEVEDWPFGASTNKLLLETSLVTGAEKWVDVDVRAPTPLKKATDDEDGEEENSEDSHFGPDKRRRSTGNSRQLLEWKLTAEDSTSSFRALSWAWVDGNFTTAEPVEVQLELSEAEKSQIIVSFLLPHFTTSLSYDPDLSVTFGSESGEGEDGGGDDALWWKILVPVLCVLMLLIVGGIIVAVIWRGKLNEKKRKNRGGSVNF